MYNLGSTQSSWPSLSWTSFWANSTLLPFLSHCTRGTLHQEQHASSANRLANIKIGNTLVCISTCTQKCKVHVCACATHLGAVPYSQGDQGDQALQFLLSVPKKQNAMAERYSQGSYYCSFNILCIY